MNTTKKGEKKIMLSVTIVIMLTLLLALGPLLNGISMMQASTDGGEGEEGGSGESNDESDEGGEEEGGGGGGGGETEGEDSNDGFTNPSCGSGDCEAVPEEPAPNSDDNDNNDREPLPYCHNDDSGSCHDIDDYDEITGKYPCNDGTQRTNKEDCPDATKPVLPTQPNPGQSRSTIIFTTTFSIQGSNGPVEQTGPLPVPKSGQALLKIIYDDEWTGNILDSNNTSISYDGDGDYSIVFPCEEDPIYGFYSLSMQKSDDDNEVLQLIVQNHLNQTIDQGQTTAEFGIVSLSGECEV